MAATLERANRPTLEELLTGAISTIREIILPDLTDPWARASAAQLTGLLSYARTIAREPEDHGELAAIQDELRRLAAEHPDIRRIARPGIDSRNPGETLQAASDVLAYAIGREDAGAEATRARLRPLLRSELARELQSAAPMLATFGGKPIDA